MVVYLKMEEDLIFFKKEDNLNFLQLEDDLNFFEKEENLNFWKMEDDLKKIMHRKTIKSKNNGCGTAPGNLVFSL
jgi:hypothetical protein